MVLCQRTCSEALPCEDDETDVVVWATCDETHCHFLGSLYTVGLEVHRQHTGGDVHREHDVDPLYLVLTPAGGTLWTCQRNNDGTQG